MYSPYAADGNAMAQLHVAVRHGDLEEVRRLIDAGTDLNAQDSKFGATPLHWAAADGKTPRQNNDRATHSVALRNREALAVVQTLLDAGAGVNARDNKFGATPLHWAAALSETPAVVQALLDAGANLEAQQDRGRYTPLHVAACYSKTSEVVQALLDAGANLEAQDEGGYTPLHVAEMYGETPEVVQILRDPGAKLEA